MYELHTKQKRMFCNSSRFFKGFCRAMPQAICRSWGAREGFLWAGDHLGYFRNLKGPIYLDGLQDTRGVMNTPNNLKYHESVL